MNQHSPLATTTIAETLARWIVGLSRDGISQKAIEISRMLIVDVAGLAIAARNEDYVAATIAATDKGATTAIGHRGGFDAFSAALINGTAAHGEDYDDTFEGGPVHSGAVIVPAVLAICEREGLSGDRLLKGVAVGVELLCRLSLVAPKAIHTAGFHPTAVIGTVAAAAAVSASLDLSESETVSAIGIAGSMAAGIIEYLAEGTWTKRMHAGNAAQSGIRAAVMARGGFLGPRTVMEGTHGFFHAFAPSRAPDFDALLRDLGQDWVMETIAFKPYACGTMTQPFIDCAIQLAETGVGADEIVEIVCDVGEGTVHRLWEPLAIKHAPQTPYAAKFSTPICMAFGFLDRKAGLAQFTEERIADPAVRALAAKIRYRIDPNDEYPKNFTGHLLATLSDGSQVEFRQPYMRGGKHAPLTVEEIETKFVDNAVYGGWSRETALAFLDLSRTIFHDADLGRVKEFAL
ncbi:MmgE/PrpD family protein [Rhizobium mayense]|uniref:MmgE/PrpD family protein n=1 Tax=Rhizobium mayense TaxID=1312184 RepID=A0ABT7JNP5_9HYPH|nr:MmgE/PrpD family protein [Rhizobium mayense]MDL2397965.1 MmgE/PrpD family protein [Rhizobium mayense]